MKPREWIIFGVACAEKGSAAYDNFQWNEGNVHVIEKSEYDRLEACCEKLADFARWLAEDSNKYKGTDAQMAASRVLAEYRAMKGEK